MQVNSNIIDVWSALMIVIIMPFSRRYILTAIAELARPDQRLTYEQIAERADCSSKTVERAVPELVRDGKIRIRGNGRGKRGGYTYEVIDANV